MGDRLDCRRARHHPDLTEPSVAADARGRLADSIFRGVVLGLLAVDGVISAVLGAFFLLIYVHGVPFPVSALASGLLNALLVWIGLKWTTSLRVAALPLWTWLFTIGVMLFGGPGGDVIYGSASGSAFDQWSPALLLFLGALPPVIVLRRASQARLRRGLR